MATQLSLVSAPDSPRRAREFVIDRLCEWGHAQLVEKASLLTSEIVTNAVVHTGAPLVLEVFNLDDGVLVTVNDADREPPRPRSGVLPGFQATERSSGSGSQPSPEATGGLQDAGPDLSGP